MAKNRRGWIMAFLSSRHQAGRPLFIVCVVIVAVVVNRDGLAEGRLPETHAEKLARSLVAPVVSILETCGKSCQLTFMCPGRNGAGLRLVSKDDMTEAVLVILERDPGDA